MTCRKTRPGSVPEQNTEPNENPAKTQTETRGNREKESCFVPIMINCQQEDKLNGESCMVGKDVAAALGYERPMDAARKHVDGEDRGVAKIEPPSGAQEMIVINESGLYSLILSSKLPSAKEYSRRK